MKQMKWASRTIVAALVLSIAALTSMADDRGRYSERQIFNLAQRNGYEFGVREGRYDSRENHRFDPKRNRAYKDGRYGYRDEYRHDEAYRNGFRDGFIAGYEDGYNRRRNDRRDDDYDYRRGRNDRRDDDYDYRRGRDDRNNGRRGRPWWDVLNGRN
jgi:hypothetical protein